MREVKLIFPDHSTLAEFVVKQKVNNAEVNSLEKAVTALMADDKIALAERIYGALKKVLPA
jgi:hypothetical protein